VDSRAQIASPAVREPVAVLGVGVEGRATIDYLLRHGVTNISALDRQVVEGLPGGVQTLFGQGYDQGLERFATVFRSPGIRPDHPELVRAAAGGARVTSAVSHLLERCPAVPVVGVTGTVGKGTAASLIAAMLEAAGFSTHLGGNIGLSPLTFLDRVKPGDRVVLEISSFQALDISRSPGVGVILKTTSEHLDWHVDAAEYRRAKANLVSRQGPADAVVFNADSAGSVEIAGASSGRHLGYSLTARPDPGLFLDDRGFVALDAGAEHRLPIDIRQVRLPGRFNLENVAAALLAARSAGADWEPICNAAEEFAGLPHRFELVAESGGIRFVNDSYATRPEATLAALTAVADEPLALILGGSEKHARFDDLVHGLSEHPRLGYVALIGATAERLERAIAALGAVAFRFEIHDGLEPAFRAAVQSLTQGGVVLLSPACASFGLFPNYKVRGETFRALSSEYVKQAR
jgi:UDP-N-acetylmuramoylalanine--D-glutamate ligase